MRKPDSRNVAVAGKDRSAVMMSGHRADQRWYWDGKTFVTDMKGASIPRHVAAARQAVADGRPGCKHSTSRGYCHRQW